MTLQIYGATILMYMSISLSEVVQMTHIKIAPDVEFKLDIDLPEISNNSRDYDLQQHKAEVYSMFEARLKKAFPEGFKINTFEFGLDVSEH
jgi:hypothetical protein